MFMAQTRKKKNACRGERERFVWFWKEAMKEIPGPRSQRGRGSGGSSKGEGEGYRGLESFLDGTWSTKPLGGGEVGGEGVAEEDH